MKSQKDLERINSNLDVETEDDSVTFSFSPQATKLVIVITAKTPKTNFFIFFSPFLNNKTNSNSSLPYYHFFYKKSIKSLIFTKNT